MPYHLPALRFGKPYTSLELAEVKDCRSGETLATVSQVNAGIIRKDLAKIGEARKALKQLPGERMIEICRVAGEMFLNDTLSLGEEGQTQTPQQYIETLSATSGLPFPLVRRNMEKIGHVLGNMRRILRGLTRGLDLAVLDRGIGEHAGSRVSFYPAAQALGVVMPSNSPGVNSLWLPAVALKIPVLIKPGREEPWTPCRLVQALIAAGCPPEAFGFYPTDHEGAAELLRSSGRALLFGDQSTTAPYASNPAIQLHGPGYSKVLIGDDVIERWQDHLDLIVSSIAENGGRSCINASAVVVPKYAAEIATALAQKLGPIAPLPATEERASISAFANPKMADAIDGMITEGLRSPGATELTAIYRRGPRKVLFEGAVHLRPTIVLCDSFAHPLANREFLFPYASVVEAPQAEMLEQIGPSLVVTAITRDLAFRQRLLESPLIERLNLGPIATTRISWDQPHEGNLFEFLYRRRAIQTT